MSDTDAEVTRRKAVRARLAEAFGRKPGEFYYYDDDRSHRLRIGNVADSPQKGVTSYSTLGLCETPLMHEGKEFHARVELVGASESKFEEFANVVATAAFFVMKDGLFVAPGVILPKVFGSYRKKSALKHLLFVPPFLWEELQTFEVEGTTIAWLMLVPITDAEMAHALAHGVPSLEKIFAREQIDIFDPARASVV